MAKSSYQKLKMIYLMDILLENTDEEHGMNMSEILNALGKYGIRAERRSIYDDLDALGKYGLDIEKENRDRTCYYHVVNRKFELVELKLLVDSIQAAKFITEQKSKNLIKKLEGLSSKYEAKNCIARYMSRSGIRRITKKSIIMSMQSMKRSILIVKSNFIISNGMKRNKKFSIEMGIGFKSVPGDFHGLTRIII